jgi:NDP-sugar pyrophosphorylase family protein
MYAWATESLPLRDASKLIFVLLEGQPGFEDVRSDIVQRYPQARPIVLSVAELTSGQSITVLTAKKFIDSNEPLLIHNADTAFDVDPAWVRHALRDQFDGALLVFRSTELRWSYSRENQFGFVAEVKEKTVISPWASTGTYWFRKGSEFVTLAEARWASGRREASEYYVGPLYNDLIQRGGRVRNYAIDRLLCFGTPEDLARTLGELERTPRAR